MPKRSSMCNWSEAEPLVLFSKPAHPVVNFGPPAGVIDDLRLLVGLGLVDYRHHSGEISRRGPLRDGRFGLISRNVRCIVSEAAIAVHLKVDGVVHHVLQGVVVLISHSRRLSIRRTFLVWSADL